MDARTFLGIHPVSDPLRWRLTVEQRLATPGNFLFGGCGLGAALVALEAAAERPTVWATAQYLSYAPTGSVVDYEVRLAAVGKHVTQARAVACSADGTEILTVNAALGIGQLAEGGEWAAFPAVPPPEECPTRQLPDFFAGSIQDHVDVRVARGTLFDEIGQGPRHPNPALWVRVPGHLDSSAAMLAIFGDYVTGGVSQVLGRPVMTRSLDNTLRMVRPEPTEWVLCDIHIHALHGGYAQGLAFLWSRDGALLATASQSMGVRLWDGAPFAEGRRRRRR